MREAIRLALVNKYKSLGYSQKAINAVLDYLEKSVKEETEIEEAVNGVGPILKSFQSEIDARVTAAEKLRKEKEEEESAEKGKSDGVDSETGKKATKKDSDEVPEWAKGLIESNKALLEANKATAEKLAAFESGKTNESRKQIFETKLKDVNPILKEVYLENFDPSKFATDDAFQEYLTSTETKISEATQKLTDQGLGQSSRPFTPAGGGGSSKQATKEELDAVMVNL